MDGAARYLCGVQNTPPAGLPAMRLPSPFVFSIEVPHCGTIDSVAFLHLARTTGVARRRWVSHFTLTTLLDTLCRDTGHNSTDKMRRPVLDVTCEITHERAEACHDVYCRNRLLNRCSDLSQARTLLFPRLADDHYYLLAATRESPGGAVWVCRGHYRH